MTSSTIKLALLSASHPAFCHLQCRKASQVTESWEGARKQGYRTVYVRGLKLIVYLSVTLSTTTKRDRASYACVVNQLSSL